ncbi:D-aminoacyl-tRNA deacylase [Pseudogracilibacillus auburnensis]|uniref:D-aminoacyl-tRNA deacylase n=1 Tax=Pseudogracilibacillus auburnensis TaxID=1494959 RepID=A0A2V3W0C3_9BACI|nr:D-aminoacyl-tRNA deacylase [Pseudogracilibacillus auburnensis]MBO1003422.1 D-tyrosyl-tRNA(Tyr) deacylase [Pseudogracilibacillus auburnensis]PXW86591.1 D-tyrosyl-tRNA(Tyr) deacylase [Pseudogracilibacillus auburnensis]
MRVVIQRSKRANVKVNNEIIGEIDSGLVILLGVAHDDTTADIDALVNKIIHLRIFEDEDHRLNLSLTDKKGSILSISQFTLYADVRKGRRPSFIKAAEPKNAEKLYDTFNEKLRENGIHVETGEFGAMMDVELINDGPVTIIMETKDGKIIDPA